MTAKAQPVSVREASDRARAFTKARARNFYYAFSSLPRTKRNAIYAVYAFAGTVDDAVDEVGSDAERVDRLQRARTILDVACRDQSDETLEQEWLTVALQQAIERYRIPKSYFLELIAGMEQDVRQTRFSTYADLELYCYRAAAVIGLISIEIFGYDRSRRDLAIEAATDMGKALQITNIMRDVKEDADRGRIYLAQEDLEAHGYSEAEVLANVDNDAFRNLMADYGRRAELLYASGLRLIPLLDGPRSRMCCNGLQGVYHSILTEIIKRDYNVYSERISPSKAGRLLSLFRLWISGAWPKRQPR
jgi:phytoene synthase